MSGFAVAGGGASAETFFSAADTDQNNEISPAEWQAASAPTPCQNYFDWFDSNQNGKLSPEEISAAHVWLVISEVCALNYH